MKLCLHNIQGMIKRLPVLVLIVVVLLPQSILSTAQVVEVIVEDPQLLPTFTTCSETYWYPFNNNRGHKAYLTLNAFNLANSTNHGEWHPNIHNQANRVEAYIRLFTITWCMGRSPSTRHYRCSLFHPQCEWRDDPFAQSISTQQSMAQPG
jgi:hypothetical protein